MQLTFDHTQLIGTGTQPSAIHTPENICQVLYVDPDSQGRIFAKDASTPMGNWADLDFAPAYMVSTDTDVEFMKLKYVSAQSLFVVWHNATEPGETVPLNPAVTHSLRHRMAVWAMRQNLSKYLVDGEIEFRLDDPVAKLNIEFENPGYIVSHEDETILTPGTSLTLFFRSGDSARYIMGRYFIDRNRMGVTESTTQADGRNAIGKLLKDQTFDDDNVFPLMNLGELAELMLESFGVQNYWVGTTSSNRGMEFPPNMTGLEGFQALLSTTSTWQLREDMAGQIGVGNRNDSRFDQPATYTFTRNKDVFTRAVNRDDQDTYSKVRVYREGATDEYRDIDFRFVMPRKKTLHVQVADNTSQEDMAAYADELAARLGAVGVVETFIGPFRPYIMPGDNARIQAHNTRLLGGITTVRHQFGKGGYFTEFTVDSGSKIGAERIRDYIDKIAGRQNVGQAKRLY